jgi:hypothetical protein
MYALMTHDVESDRSQDAEAERPPGPPELVLVEGDQPAIEPKPAQARRRRPPLPTLHLAPDEILTFPAA